MVVVAVLSSSPPLCRMLVFNGGVLNVEGCGGEGGAVELLLVYSCHFHLLHHCHYTLSHPQPTRIIVHTFAILCVSVGRSPVGLGLLSPESQQRRKQDAELLKKEI